MRIKKRRHSQARYYTRIWYDRETAIYAGILVRYQTGSIWNRKHPAYQPRRKSKEEIRRIIAATNKPPGMFK